MGPKEYKTLRYSWMVYISQLWCQSRQWMCSSATSSGSASWRSALPGRWPEEWLSLSPVRPPASWQWWTGRPGLRPSPSGHPGTVCVWAGRGEGRTAGILCTCITLKLAAWVTSGGGKYTCTDTYNSILLHGWKGTKQCARTYVCIMHVCVSVYVRMYVCRYICMYVCMYVRM